jgi:hypothetical protein
MHITDCVLGYMLDRSWAETHRRHGHSGILQTVLSSTGDILKNFRTNFMCGGNYIRLTRIKLKFTLTTRWLQRGATGWCRGKKCFSASQRPDQLWGAASLHPLRTGDLSPWVKKPESEADHSPPCSTEVKKVGVIPPLPTRLNNVVLN